jgi:hypothetical protein
MAASVELGLQQQCQHHGDHGHPGCQDTAARHAAIPGQSAGEGERAEDQCGPGMQGDIGDVEMLVEPVERVPGPERQTDGQQVRRCLGAQAHGQPGRDQPERQIAPDRRVDEGVEDLQPGPERAEQCRQHENGP